MTQRPTPKVSSSQKPTSVNRNSKRDTEWVKVNCHFCGHEQERKREKCPAWGKTCDNCKGRNHFKSKCKKVNAVSQVQDVDNDYDDQ